MDVQEDIGNTLKVEYDAIGSGGGKAEFFRGENLFAGSDSDISKAQTAFVLPEDFQVGYKVDPANINPDVKDHEGVLFIPALAGGLGIVYNLGKDKDIQLDLNGELLALIFTQELEWWNDTRIQALNTAAELPNTRIQVVVRSGGSGSTQVFTKYMSEVKLFCNY
ncbi:MAG: hypothetical protein SGCHY_001434 [Lobulomycetales sp.]